MLRKKALRDQLLGALKVTLGGDKSGVGLHHGLRGDGRGHGGLLCGAATGFQQRGFGLLQAGLGLLVRQAQQHGAGLDAVAFAHAHFKHRGSNFRANVHARRHIDAPGCHH